MKRFLVIIGIAYVSACLASIAAAETRIDFLTPGADKELVSALRSSSLLIQASRDKTEDPQELLAAAQADYARLLGVLYSSARYGGVITIAIDGREAASIPPLAAPNSINAIVVQVDPGPTYLFSEASVAPIATLTELPEGFAPGQPAESDVIGDAAGAAVDGWRAQGHAKAQVQDQRIVARHYNVSKTELLSNRRTRTIVKPRQVAMYLSKVMTPRSLPEIGRRFGGRDHTTVLHAVRKIEQLSGDDNTLAQELELLRRLISDQA